MIEMMVLNPTIDLHRTDENGLNAFLIATWNNRINVMHKLMTLGCNIFACSFNGSNALHLAVKLRCIEAARMLLRISSFPRDSMKHNGVTAVAIAAYNGDVTMLNELVDSGCDLNLVSSQGIGPMYLAIKGEKIDSISYLLRKKVPILNLNARGEKLDNSPLFFSIKQLNIKVLMTLCEDGHYEA